MITGFENITTDLTPYQIDTIVPAVVDLMTFRIGEHMAITSNKAIRELKRDHDINVAQPTFRKVINHIRIHGLIDNLVATSRGYYIAGSRSDCERYLESLGQRIRSIEMVHDALEYQMEQAKKGTLKF